MTIHNQKKFHTCPNCDEPIKNGVFSKNRLLPEKATIIINEYSDKKSERHCEKCSYKLYFDCEEKLKNEKRDLSQKLNNSIENIPVVSIHSPLKWDYKVLGMVTGQTTTGTGVLTEFTSSFTDFFGVQSERHNKKLKNGENMCLLQLRSQTLDMGGNAVIATDIDYSEVGSGGMLMVCMTGTSINLENIEILGKEKKKIIEEVKSIKKRLSFISGFKIPQSPLV
jgi:uncharacterized protein YbjQ (UPF0145 family)